MSDAQKPVAIYRGVVDCGDAGAFDLDMLTMIPRGAKLYTAPTTLTPPDGWEEAVQPAHKRTLSASDDHLSMAIGVIMGFKQRHTGYMDNSVIDKFVAQVVEYLKDWTDTAEAILDMDAKIKEHEMTDASREALIKELRMIEPLSHGHFSDVGNRAADMLEADARDTAWQRGFQSGVSSNEKTAKDAVAALAVEQAAHRETNRLMTEALMQAEAQQVAVPDGYVLVPIEPTPAMMAAGFCVSEAEHDPAGVYRAMLAVKLDLHVLRFGNMTTAKVCTSLHAFDDRDDGNPLAATRRAILRCAAEVGKAIRAEGGAP